MGDAPIERLVSLLRQEREPSSRVPEPARIVLSRKIESKTFLITAIRTFDLIVPPPTLLLKLLVLSITIAGFWLISRTNFAFRLPFDTG